MVAKDKPRRFAVRTFPPLEKVGILDEDERIDLPDGEIIQRAPLNMPHVGAVNRSAQCVASAVAGHAVLGIQRSGVLGLRRAVPPTVAVLARRDDDPGGTLPTATDIAFLIEIAGVALQAVRVRRGRINGRACSRRSGMTVLPPLPRISARAGILGRGRHALRRVRPHLPACRDSDDWVVDLNGGHLLVHREPTPTGYRIVHRYDRGESVAPLAFPDLTVPVEAVLGPAGDAP
jgi:hypothetical protein